NQRIYVSRIQSQKEALHLEKIKEEEKQYLAETLNGFEESIRDLQSQINGLSDERKSVDTTCEAEVRKVYKQISEKEKADKNSKDVKLASLDSKVAEFTKEYYSKLKQLEDDEAAKLSDSGADIRMLDNTRKELTKISEAIGRIESERVKIIEYRKDCRELLDHVPQMQVDKKKIEDKQETLKQKYDHRRNNLDLKLQKENEAVASLHVSYKHAIESKLQANEFTESNACPAGLKETSPIPTELDCSAIISGIQGLMVEIHKFSDMLKEKTNEFRKRFSPNNTFKFPTTFDTLEDYHRYADSLEDFVSNNKIKDFQQVTSNLYRDILSRAASDFNFLLGRESEIIRLVKSINQDFEKKTFAGVIRSIELKLDRSIMPIITQLQHITDFWNSHQYELGEVNLFSADEHTDINKESIKYLKSLSISLHTASDLKKLPLEQIFALKFRIQENDNMTDWVENIRAVGSEGTDILVKAIINILLISVFKNRAGQGGDFRLHCMMDEIGRLADENIQGILNFANQRGIYIVNSSPKAHRPLSY
ncbi:MAG: ATP-binding protein, partial [Muribaculaceae bacterium]|nr:ATP-binding protein [Muribaculaceae bacterium]